jgi:rod shape-determining protein MreD
MRRIALFVLLLATAALVETTLLSYVAVGGFRPDLLVLIVAVSALRDGPVTGTALGFVAGTLHDLLLSGSVLGIHALVLVVVGYAVGVLRTSVPRESITAPLVVAFASGFVATAGYGVLSGLFSDGVLLTTGVGATALVVAVYNTLLAPVAVTVVRGLDRRYPRQRSVVI